MPLGKPIHSGNFTTEYEYNKYIIHDVATAAIPRFLVRLALNKDSQGNPSGLISTVKPTTTTPAGAGKWFYGDKGNWKAYDESKNKEIEVKWAGGAVSFRTMIGGMN